MTSPATSRLSPDRSFPWHTLDPEAALEKLQSDRSTGLTADQVTAKLQQFGFNELEETAGRSAWVILLDQFKNIMLVMLIVVAIVSACLDFWDGRFPKDAIAIAAIVILNGLLGYLQESRAEKALAALKRLASPQIRVVRRGREVEVAAKELVPGDIMLVEAGDQVAADGRLLTAANLQVRESALTGEAVAVAKQAAVTLPEATALGDRVNLIFQGTEVVRGRAAVLVIGTGMQTELGRIAAMLQAVETEPTPLQQRMVQLGNVLVSGALILVALVVVGGILRTGSLQLFDELLEVSLSMAVAVVPEGLPAVITVTLALGTQRMVRRNALIRKLPAVETLGSVTTICSDKTGTLTQNKMVVQEVHTFSQSFQVTGEGYSPLGEFWLTEQIAIPERFPALQVLLMACALCNDASLQHEGSLWTILGDPTEGALLALAGKVGFDKARMTERLPRVAEVPFSSERKRMSVIVAAQPAPETDEDKPAALLLPPSNFLMFTKGSPELVLERCTQVYRGQSLELLTAAARDRILEQNNQMAQQGLRVLGFAARPLAELPAEEGDALVERELIWLGLVGMLDAPRPEVRAAVAECRRAGIRPVMITGDHQLTAQAVAHDLGITQPGDAVVLSGQDLERLSLEELEQQVSRTSVYARVAPEHKLQIVQALQRRNQFVAMTGDGVNDAPALKQADIGVAMGVTGTDVSKEASDMVLLDDNFATIVAAVEEGRVVYTNIRRFVKYILGSNIGEVLTIAAAPIIGLGDVPLTPLQILWMNLVTDGLPALALAVEPAEPDIMRRPPFNPRESIFARGLGAYMLRIGLVFSILTIVLMVWAYSYTRTESYPGNPEAWKTMVFTTLCLAQMGHALAVRSDFRLTLRLNPCSNPYLLGAVTITTALQLSLIYVPFLRNFFGIQYLGWPEVLVCLGFSTLMFVWIELEKLFRLRYGSRRSVAASQRY